MTTNDQFRVPQLGDTIRTTTPINCDSVTHVAGQYLHVKLDTPAAVDEASRLVASRRWCVVESEKEQS